MNSEFDVAAAEPESKERRLRFAKDAVSLMLKKDQSQGHQLREVEEAHVAAEAAR